MKIFNEEFNLGIGYPRSNTCQMCDGLRIAIEAASDQTKCEELNFWLSISLKLVLDISIYGRIHNWPNLIQMFMQSHLICNKTSQYPRLPTQPCFIFASFGSTALVYMNAVVVMVSCVYGMSALLVEGLMRQHLACCSTLLSLDLQRQSWLFRTK